MAVNRSDGGVNAPMPKARERRPLPPLLRLGRWPKELPCLRCDQLRVSSGPGDRLHAKCREAVIELDSGPAARVLR